MSTSGQTAAGMTILDTKLARDAAQPGIQPANGGITMETPEPTWQPREKHGSLTTQSDLPDTVYAFPEQRKEPLTDASPSPR